MTVMREELRAGWFPCLVVVVTVIALTAIFDLGAPGIYLGLFIGVPVMNLWADRRRERRHPPPA